MNFSIWNDEINAESDSIKRYNKAKTAELSPVSIDKENQTGVFKGSGKNPYNVTLEFCPCGDYRRRKKPCKHIYRLALELGLIHDDFDVGINKYSLNEYLFKLPVDVQREFYYMCHAVAYGENKNAFFAFTRSFANQINLETLVVNGFCTEQRSDYAKIFSCISVSHIKELCKDLEFDNKPKYNAFTKTYLNWIQEIENNNVSILNNYFYALELTNQTVKNAHTILSRFRKKFIAHKTTQTVYFDGLEYETEQIEYEEIFDNQII